jgi:SH3 domain protein
MKLFKILILLLVINTPVYAETIYVTEKLKLDMRRGPSIRHKIVKMLPSGTPLTVLERNPAPGYALVRTDKGVEGYILSRFTQRTPAARQLMEQVKQELEQSKIEIKRLNEGLLAQQADNNLNSSDNNALTEERNKLTRELQELKKTASSAIQLKQERDQLQERVVNIERKNQQLEREKQTLEDTSNQDWFLNGGIIAFFGIFFGLIIPKLSWQRRRGGWDSF